jgi:hypothetical protein
VALWHFSQRCQATLVLQTLMVLRRLLLVIMSRQILGLVAGSLAPCGPAAAAASRIEDKKIDMARPFRRVA